MMDLVDIDKVLDDLELDEDKVLSKSERNSDDKNVLASKNNNIENKSINTQNDGIPSSPSSILTPSFHFNTVNATSTIPSSSSLIKSVGVVNYFETTNLGNQSFSTNIVNNITPLNICSDVIGQQQVKLEKVTNAETTSNCSTWNSMNNIITTVCSNNSNSFDTSSLIGGTGGCAGGVGGSSDSICNAGNIIHERSHHKNNGSSNRIIAVSQVFNSLDEYRRDVESLRVDIDKINSTDDDLNINQTSKNNHKNVENIINNFTQSRDFSKIKDENEIKLINNVRIPKSESEIDIKSDISDIQQDDTKFSNEYLLGKMIEDEDDSVDGITSSSSITTSSPSSFSSGPSPRSPSSADCIVDDDLNELNEYDGDIDISSIQSNNINNKSEEISENKNETTTTKENIIPQIFKTKENIKSINISKIATTTTCTAADDDEILEDSNGQNSIDLVGLSSISSSLYIENSLSSIQPELQSPNNEQNNRNSIKLNVNLSNVKINDEKFYDNEINSSSICKIKSKNDKIILSDNNDDDVVSTPPSTKSEFIKNCDISDKKDKDRSLNNIDNDKKDDKNSSVINSIQRNNEKGKDEEYKENNLSQKNNYNLPITFGSTMDEISDTELDSMLQDIDNESQNSGMNKEKIILKNETFTDFQKVDEASYKEEANDKPSNAIDSKNNICFSNISSTSQKDIDESFEKSSKNFQINSPTYKDESSNPSIQEYDSVDDIKINSKSIDDDINLQNADSFSQASTIEFADLQSQNDLGGILNDNEINSNGAGCNVYNSNNKINRMNEDNDNNNLKVKLECDNIVVDSKQNPKINDNNQSSAVATVATIKNDDTQLEFAKNDNDSNILKKDTLSNVNRRPRVLNLPITNSTSIGLSKNSPPPPILDTNNRIDTLNIDGTAGQTPPAQALTNLNTSLSNFSQEISPITLSPSTTITNQLEQDQGNYNDLNDIIETSQDSNILQNDNQENEKITTGTTIATQLTNKMSTTIESSSPSSHIAINTKKQIGKVQPFWIPDCEASYCMQCKVKFSLIKRRHHCRACGHVLCSLCCSQKAKLEFLGNDNEVRVCIRCHLIINNIDNNIIESSDNQLNDATISELGAVGGISSSGDNIIHSNTININNETNGIRINSGNNVLTRSPNPNNPMEYCSTIPPHEQVKKNRSNNKPISVMVPVGVLKREGTLSKNRKDKNVIFSDGIRPGCDLADLDNSWSDKSGGISNNNLQQQQNISNKKMSNDSKEYIPLANPRILRKILPQCDENNSYIPKEVNALPPIYEKIAKTNEYDYIEVANNNILIERLQKECLKFAVQRNFYVYVKIVKLTCCVNKTVINFTTNGMHHVGQDEIIILLEYDNSNLIPKDIFIHLNEIYRNADKGHPITELGYSIANQQNFLCNNIGTGTTKPIQLSSLTTTTTTNGGFLYIRSTFQCLQEIQLPDPPFLIGVLIHKWEIPWAKIFPLRLMLRLGAQYRYYPSPHLSIRGRNSVYAEIAQTFINYLADFRNYSYTIPIIKGMFIHMEDRKTSVLIPKNRHDQIIKALNNSSDYILALGGNFSKTADGHLVCIQNLESDCPDSHTYSTQAINIQGQPRRVTGASFIVLNGALKTNSGLSGKCSIIEDGLMVHILPQKMQMISKNLRSMSDIDIRCGPLEANESQTETVSIQWVDDDTEFNIGVTSPIDDKKLDGISSIRVHSGLNYCNTNFIIRWTEVFLVQAKEETTPGKISIDISKIAEQIARSASTALVPLLDLLVATGCIKIALRVTLHQDNVCYEAGSKNFKLAPLYMNALDNELIPILHKQATMYGITNPIILELIFHILYK